VCRTDPEPDAAAQRRPYRSWVLREWYTSVAAVSQDWAILAARTISKMAVLGGLVIPPHRRRNGNVNIRMWMDTEWRVHSTIVRRSAVPWSTSNILVVPRTTVQSQSSSSA
jgi:hypothetical protein